MSESSLSPVTVARSTLVVVVVLTACATAYTARGAVVLVFFGAFVAVAVEPVVAALVRRGWKRGSAVGLLLLGGVVLLVLLVLLLLVPASQQLGSLVADLPARLAAMSDHLGGEATSSGSYVGTASTQETWADAIRHTTALVSAAAAGIFGLAGAVLGAGLTAFSITALAVYFSMAMPRVRGGLEGALRTEGRIAAVEESLAKISGYVIGQFLICVVAGVCAFGFFALAGVPYPALLALVVLALDAIPQVGATLASLAGIAVALTVSVPLAIVTLAYFLVYQQVENYLVAPRVFSRTIQISPLGAFIAVLVGGAVAGVLGAVLALPIAGAGAVVLRQIRAEGAPGTGPATEQAASAS